jgi:hypothetical protein
MDIKGINPGIPMVAGDIEKERLKEIKTRAGKAAFSAIMGDRSKTAHVTNGIHRSESALKWIDEVINGDKWKDS